MNPSSKSIAIVLVNWNGFDHTIKCIDSLRTVSYSRASIVLVDNGSEEKELERLREIPNVILIENEKNLGFTGGNNVGIKYAYESGFDFIMLLNNDTTVEPGFIEPLINELEESVGAVQPKIYSMHDREQIWSAGGRFKAWIGLPVTIGEGSKDNGQFDEIKTLDWITGCCLTFRREMVDEVGYLDDTYFILFEDADWSLRARSKGYNLLYIPDSKIYHFESATAVSRKKGKEGYRSPFRQYINIRNHLFLVRKHVPAKFMFSAAIYQMVKITKFLVYYVLRGRWTKFRYTLRAIRDGLGKPKIIEPQS